MLSVKFTNDLLNGNYPNLVLMLFSTMQENNFTNTIAYSFEKC